MAFSQSAETGYKLGLDPFSKLFQRLDEADKRKREDQKDLQELNKFFMGLKYQSDSARSLKEMEGEQELKKQRELNLKELNILLLLKNQN